MLSLEAVAMFRNHKNIKIIFGTSQIENNSSVIFDDEILNFLGVLSEKILNNKEAKKFPDLFTLGFWCRKSNLIKLKKDYNSEDFRLGRGLVLHITPSNVPLTFAYSLIFGLISGNSNIVRLPSKNFEQVKLLIQILSLVLKKKKFTFIKKRFVLIKYKNSDDISEYLSKIVDGRLVWGGDKTVSKFKSFVTSPRCVDLFFANRFSVCLINIKSLNKLKDIEIKKLCNKFYNDSYLMDQMGCSSPLIVFWLGSKESKYKEKFWNFFSQIVNEKYDFDLSASNKKISNLTKLILNEKNLKPKYDRFNLLRINFKHLSERSINLNPHYGSFYEVKIDNLKKLSPYINKKLQTLIYFSFKKKELKNLIINEKIKGVDRFVPFGRAFDLNTKWDGYDIILNLSRIIAD